MDTILLIKFIAILSGLLGLLVLLYLYTSYTKKTQKKTPAKPSQAKETKPDFDTLLAVIQDKKSTTQELKEAADLIVKYYGKIPKKLGMRVHPKFEKYSRLILSICYHPHITKDIILKLDKELQRHNPEYTVELNDSLTKGLNTRGI